jgi:glycosyltransferase involved in cell wall biosynthesis
LSDEERAAIAPENFEPSEYRVRYADLADYNDAQSVEHFLAHGMHEGRFGRLTSEEVKAISPEGFSPADYRRLYSDVANLSDAETLEHYLAFGFREGRRGKVPTDIAAILEAGEFDPQEYRLRYADVEELDDEQALVHFIDFGAAEGRRGRLSEKERRAISPQRFSPREYRSRYPDVAHLSDAEVREHLLNYGLAEGRGGRFASRLTKMPSGKQIAGRETVLVVIHEASVTGAPLVAWNLVSRYARTRNVVVVLGAGGRLREALSAAGADVVLADAEVFASKSELRRFVTRITSVYQPSFAVIATSVMYAIVPQLVTAGVPSVLLNHEFAPSPFAPKAVRKGVRVAVEAAPTVFSSETVMLSYRERYPGIDLSHSSLVRQGTYTRPVLTGDVHALTPRQVAVLERLRGSGEPLILGIGSLNSRKGVEFFLQAAAYTREVTDGSATPHFVWIGDRNAGASSEYEDFIMEHLRRAHLDDVVSFVGEVDDLESFYTLATAVFLSSRLDPLPNSALDALHHGVPLVSFDGAGGIPEIMGADPEAAELVVAYGDSHAAAMLFARIVSDADFRHAMSVAGARALLATEGMETYAQRVAELAGFEVDGPLTGGSASPAT